NPLYMVYWRFCSIVELNHNGSCHDSHPPFFTSPSCWSPPSSRFIILKSSQKRLQIFFAITLDIRYMADSSRESGWVRTTRCSAILQNIISAYLVDMLNDFMPHHAL